jgi:hypothetical protein
MHEQAITEFNPHPLLRPSLTQTLLSMRRPRRLAWLHTCEQPMLFDAGPDVTGYQPHRHVRLLGYYNPARPAANGATRPDGSRRGVVMTLHGWCGCSHSTYNMVLTDALVRAGYDVVRLNLRDHGPNLHVDRARLNTGVFLGTLIGEAAAATARVAELAGERPFYIVGSSMGGNFAMRLALWFSRQPLGNLQHVIAVSPAIDPASATDAIDANPFYRYYFRSRWLASLLEKQRLFPHLFDFTAVEQTESIRAMTDKLIRKYTDYGGADDYFAHYAVKPTALHDLTVPTTVVTASNDHVIPESDFAVLPAHPLLDVRMYESGGHVGFVQGFPPRHALPEIVLSILQEHSPYPGRFEPHYSLC